MCSQEQILNFIYNYDKLEILKSNLNRFNPFKILKIEDYEIRHSNILSWLLNPNENHNFDDKFLKKYLASVISNPDNDDAVDENISILDIQKSTFTDLRVYREKYNIDILLQSKSNKLIVLIENKYLSSEHSNQLNRYLDTIKALFNNYKFLPIYLSLDGDRPSNLQYCISSYSEIIKVIQFMKDIYKDRTTSEVIAFLDHYITILKEKLYMDANIKELCKIIYNENKEIVDLIYTIGNEIDIRNAINEFKKEFNNIEDIWANNKSCWFLLPEFKKTKYMNSDWADGYPVAYWFSEYYGKLKIVLEIGPFDNDSKRLEFLKLLEKNNINISNRAKEAGRKFTRIYTNTVEIKDWSDTQELSEKMIKLFSNKSLRNIENNLLLCIKEFNWQ